MTQAFDLAVNALVQAKRLLEQSRALSRPGAAPQNLDADQIRNEVFTALHRRVGQHADRDAAIAAEHEEAILEAAWWRHMIARQGGPAAPVSRWADLAAEEFDRRTNNAIATLQRRADESVDAANALPEPVEKHAEIEHVAPVAQRDGDTTIAELVDFRTQASVARYLDLAGKAAIPFAPKEVALLAAAHRFYAMEGVSDAIRRWPAVGGTAAAAEPERPTAPPVAQAPTPEPTHIATIDQADASRHAREQTQLLINSSREEGEQRVRRQVVEAAGLNNPCAKCAETAVTGTCDSDGLPCDHFARALVLIRASMHAPAPVKAPKKERAAAANLELFGSPGQSTQIAQQAGNQKS